MESLRQELESHERQKNVKTHSKLRMLRYSSYLPQIVCYSKVTVQKLWSNLMVYAKYEENMDSLE